jgi:hypothetical protein
MTLLCVFTQRSAAHEVDVSKLEALCTLFQTAVAAVVRAGTATVAEVRFRYNMQSPASGGVFAQVDGVRGIGSSVDKVADTLHRFNLDETFFSLHVFSTSSGLATSSHPLPR